jgi:hypothetical protein
MNSLGIDDEDDDTTDEKCLPKPIEAKFPKVYPTAT